MSNNERPESTIFNSLAPSNLHSQKPEGMDYREWEAKAYNEHVREVFQSAFAEAQFTPEDTLPHRTLAAWRVTRMLARIKGFVAPDEGLAEMVDDAGDYWYCPRETLVPRGATSYSGYDPEILNTLNEAESIGTGYQTIIDLYTFEEKRGLALTPPPVPIALRNDDGSVPDLYNPHEDPMLLRWVKVVDAIGTGLRILDGSRELPNMGRLGFMPLIDPETVRESWPLPSQIMEFEELLVDEMMERILEMPTHQIQKYFRERFGFQRVEIEHLGKMARRRARTISEADVEDDRGVMLLRLEDALSRARQSLDLRAETAILKQIALVQGLARTDPNDTMKDLMEVIVDKARERRAQRVLSSSDASRLALPAPGVGSQGEIIEQGDIDE